MPPCSCVRGGKWRPLESACIAIVVWLGAADAFAQRFPLRCYDETAGLSQNLVSTAVQDHKGYLWIGTGEGLSRFDGYRFVTYDASEGLPHLYINHVTVDRAGRLWVGTNGGGLARLIDEPGSSVKFITYRLSPHATDANNVNALIIDANDVIWAATDDGLYRGALGTGDPVRFDPVAGLGHRNVVAAFADRDGRLWFWVRELGVVSIEKNRAIEYAIPADGWTRTPVSFDQDSSGTLRVAALSGVYEFSREDRERGAWTRIKLPLDKQATVVGLRSDAGGKLWIGTSRGLLAFDPRSSRSFSPVADMNTGTLRPLIEDRTGNLWFGAASGLCRVPSEPVVVSYTAADGLPSPVVLGVFEAADGRLYASTEGGVVEIRDDGIRRVAGSELAPINRLGRSLIQVRSGDWWAMLSDRLLRFRGPALQFEDPVDQVPAVLFSPSGLGAPGTIAVAGFGEDAVGRLLVPSADGGLHWFDPRSPRDKSVQAIRTGTGAQPMLVPAIVDPSGTVWLTSMNDIGRLRGGRLESLAPGRGLPETTARSMYLDRRGRLWIGLRNRGVSVTEHPEADVPEFVNYSTVDGLSSNSVWSIAEDAAGRMYLATSRGLDRLEPQTGRIRHFTTADGLPGNFVTFTLRDSRDRIWVATRAGLARVTTATEPGEKEPPPIHIARVQIEGEEYPLPETGSERVSIEALDSDRNNIELEYVSVGLARPPLYQHRLEGIDRTWSKPTDQRVINYARLAPGRYEFHVRAINSEGIASARAAGVVFEILPPVWQRSWFIALAIAVLSLAGLTFHRLQLRQAVALERVRRRLATDLHDDIGAGLSQIAILSEVSRRDFAAGREYLPEIAGLARGMRESMDDIVWALNPRADRLANLVERMRQVAANSLEAKGLDLSFVTPAVAEFERIGLDAATRRHLLLIVKEATTNVARHADASRVEIAMEIGHVELRLSIRDDGKGFDPAALHEGQGLASIRRRAAELGGRLELTSSEAGTLLRVSIPLR